MSGPSETSVITLRPEDHAVYTPGGMGKATLFESPRLLVGLNAFEPGQTHRLHTHPGMDKIYMVLDGRATLLLDDRTETVDRGTMTIVPEGVAHGLRNDSNERLLVLAVLAPSPRHG
ncbi:MAG: cupin domain-containing protein [Vicinamibacterales bacterium]